MCVQSCAIIGEVVDAYAMLLLAALLVRAVVWKMKSVSDLFFSPRMCFQVSCFLDALITVRLKKKVSFSLGLISKERELVPYIQPRWHNHLKL